MDELETILKYAQEGHQESRDKIISRFRPLIVKTAFSLTGKYIDASKDDEMTIGMMAVDQAITSYRREKGAGFFGYAEMIIKRRLIDYYRQEQRSGKAIPFSSLEAEDEQEQGNSLARAEYSAAVSQYQKNQESSERREEIMLYSQKLREYGIVFQELTVKSPKHEDARNRAVEAARLVASNQEMLNHLRQKKELPLKRLETMVQMSRKTLERQRKYIIALTVILSGEYIYLKDYLKKLG